MQKPMINGIEVKVGQKWKAVNGVTIQIASVNSKEFGENYPIKAEGGSHWTIQGLYLFGKCHFLDLVELVQDAEQPKAKARVVEYELEGTIIYKLEVLQENGEYAVVASSNHKDGLIKQSELYSTVKRKVIHEVF